ncbi:MAG TPA: hypothetical protein VEC92_03485 [Nitrososphaerales archaeon]|nr:hypothetical protein [Nitrososphaerales archaeon]
MPREIKTKEEFEKLLEEAVEIRVKRDGEVAKVKLRTPSQLYTFKTSGDEADTLTKGAKAEVVEL